MLQLHNEMFYLAHYRNNGTQTDLIVYVRILLLTIALAAIWGVTPVSGETFHSARVIIRAAASAPDNAFLLLAFGALAVCVEFIRPGMVVPGVAGAFAIMLGSWAFAAHGVSPRKVHSATALAVGIPVTTIAAILFFFAYQSRRNKIALPDQIGSDKTAAIRLR
jgi:hypothetical protein